MMNEDEISKENLLMRIERLEQFMFKDFVRKVQKIVEWHDHGSSGKMHWNLPPEILTDEFQKELSRIKGFVKQGNKKEKTLVKSAIDRPTDEIDIQLTPITKNGNS